ncbi:MAG: dihydrolipoyl dehydrogenase [Pseudomonadota bacterium]|jgi:dihydrolipoamide dehydrogenase
MADFDVVVIGGGPGGYVAAIRAAQLGLKAACVEGWTTPSGQLALGGTCLNVGCIPSKALLESSEHFEQAQHGLGEHGVQVSGVKLDLATLLKRKDGIVGTLTGGIQGLFKKNKVEWLRGFGRLEKVDGGEWQVVVEGADGARIASATHVILATGSRPRPIAAAPIDGKAIVDNAGALAFESVPKKLGVIGAGVIGLELGSVWRRLGSEVMLLEALPGFLGLADAAIAAEARKQFTAQGLDIRLGATVTATKVSKSGVQVTYQDADGEHTATFEKLIVAVGRVPYTDGSGAREAGVVFDERGFIVTDAQGRTNLANVWAVGDCTPGPMLAHKASEEGVMVAECIAGQHGHCDHAVIPWVIYTHPEIAWVGQTEAQLKAAGIDHRSGTFPFAANGRARSLGNPSGFVKMLACARTDRLLGVHIIGPQASELISEAVVAMSFGAASEDLARIVHAHPTLSESMHEAALAVDGRTLHL